VGGQVLVFVDSRKRAGNCARLIAKGFGRAVDAWKKGTAAAWIEGKKKGRNNSNASSSSSSGGGGGGGGGGAMEKIGGKNGGKENTTPQRSRGGGGIAGGAAGVIQKLGNHVNRLKAKREALSKRLGEFEKYKDLALYVMAGVAYVDEHHISYSV
jgi:hypothetical protein